MPDMQEVYEKEFENMLKVSGRRWLLIYEAFMFNHLEIFIKLVLKNQVLLNRKTQNRGRQFLNHFNYYLMIP
jgi:hypothetical protein